MKKIITLVLSLLLFGSLTGCAAPAVPETMPEDFSFALVGDFNGTGPYDSATGTLVKTTDATHPEDYVTTLTLAPEQKEMIYTILQALDINTYPNVYNPHEDGTSTKPPMTLILTVRAGGSEKTIEAKGIAYTYEANNPRGQAFLTACETIINILTTSEEWKALPDYENFYA